SPSAIIRVSARAHSARRVPPLVRRDSPAARADPVHRGPPRGREIHCGGSLTAMSPQGPNHQVEDPLRTPLPAPVPVLNAGCDAECLSLRTVPERSGSSVAVRECVYALALAHQHVRIQFHRMSRKINRSSRTTLIEPQRVSPHLVPQLAGIGCSSGTTTTSVRSGRPACSIILGDFA